MTRTHIKVIGERKTWDDFINKINPNTFLHSWNWKMLQESLGESTVAVAAYEGNDPVGVALGITVSAKRGSFLFCPHGPIIKEQGGEDKETLFMLLDALARETKSRNLSFLRVSPLLPDNARWRETFAAKGFRGAPIHMHAETMWIIDIRPEEEQLMQGMRKTTRNLIRRASREGVSVRVSSESQDLAKFENIYRQTAERERFMPFSSQFLLAEYNAFVRQGDGFLALAEHQGKVLAAALIVSSGRTGFYHQGASSRSSPKIPAAYLLQWEIIRALKAQGTEHYNLWGIAPSNNHRHPWAGLTLFKQGFGGYRVDTLHAQDLPLKSSYWATYTIERLRRWRRGL